MTTRTGRIPESATENSLHSRLLQEMWASIPFPMKSIPIANARAAASGRVLDYLSLAKPRSVLPHLLTAAAAMVLAVGRSLAGDILLFTLAGGGLVAAAANVFNSYLDRDIDALMLRTRRRPLPAGRIKPPHALLLGASIGLAGTVILGRLVDWKAALLAVLALAYYVVPYTLWLKRRTYWSTIVCSGIGAMPPLVGSIAVTGGIGRGAIILSAIVVLWTMPHFWSLAVFRRREYEMAGIRLISDAGAARWTAIFSVPLVTTTLLLAPVAHMGLPYLWIAAILGTGFLAFALRLVRTRKPSVAMHFYAYSIVYLAVMFGSVVVDRLLR